MCVCVCVCVCVRILHTVVLIVHAGHVMRDIFRLLLACVRCNYHYLLFVCCATFSVPVILDGSLL